MLRIVELGQDWLQADQEFYAGVRQGHRTGVPGKERGADLALERCDGPRCG